MTNSAIRNAPTISLSGQVKDSWYEAACHMAVGKDSIKVIGQMSCLVENSRNHMENFYYSPEFSWFLVVVQRQ